MTMRDAPTDERGAVPERLTTRAAISEEPESASEGSPARLQLGLVSEFPARVLRVARRFGDFSFFSASQLRVGGMSEKQPVFATDWVARARPTAINVVLKEARKLEAEGKKLVSLMRGQPDTPTPIHIIEAANRALRDGRTGYPDIQGEPGLRGAVAEKLARDQGLHYDPDGEILITDGATCGIAVALAALLQPGDAVLLPDPIYDAYLSPIALWGGRVGPVSAAVRGGRFMFDRAALEDSWTPRTKVLLLNTPWNPVGTVFTPTELCEIMDFASTHDLFVISDEIYEALVYDGRAHVSPARLSTHARDRTLLVNSLSKTYAMTGWRVGYCAGPAAIIRAMLRSLAAVEPRPGHVRARCGGVCLASSQQCVRQMAAEYQERRDRVVSRLSGIPGVEPSGAGRRSLRHARHAAAWVAVG